MNEALRLKIEELIKEQFADVSPKIVADTLLQLVESYRAKALGMDEASVYRLIATQPEEIFRLVRDILTVGAVIFEKNSTVEHLHQEVLVHIEIPDENISITTTGRPVHVYETGTVVELTGITPEDRANLEPIFERRTRAISAKPPTYQPNQPIAQPIASQLPLGVPRQIAPRVPLRRMVQKQVKPIGDSGRAQQFKLYDQETSTAETAASRVRLFEVPEPDERVVTAGPDEGKKEEKKAITSTSELFGPATPWVSPQGGPDRQDTLTDDVIRDIILQLARDSFTGILECAHQDTRYQLKFDAGLFVQVAAFPRIPELEFGPMLRDASHITSQQLAMAAAYADEKELEIERALFELEILDVEKIRSAIAGRLTFFLKRIFNWKSGKVRVYGEKKCAPGFLPEPPFRSHVVVERILFGLYFEETRSLERQKRERLLFPHMESYPEIVEEEREMIDRTLTEPDHLALVARIASSRRRLQEVITESAMSNIETISVMWALFRMGYVRFDTSLHHSIIRERYREKVTVKYLSVHKASFFEILNVHWSSYDEIIENAYKDLIKQFDPEKIPSSMEPEVVTRVSEIRQQIEDAYSVLSTRETRHAYRQRVMPKYKLSHAIPLFIKQIELALQRNDKNDARDNILRVLEIEPDNARAKRLLRSIED